MEDLRVSKVWLLAIFLVLGCAQHATSDGAQDEPKDADASAGDTRDASDPHAGRDAASAVPAANAAACDTPCCDVSPDILLGNISNGFLPADPRIGQREQRFVDITVSLDTTPDTFCPETAVDAIYVTGPNDYRYDLRIDQPQSGWTNGGYILDRANGIVWFRDTDTRGFIDNGRYTMTIELSDGAVKTWSRTLDYDPALLDAYLAHRDEMQVGPDYAGNAAGPVTVSWSTLEEVAGLDAYYALRVDDSAQLDMTDLMYFDNIFGRSLAGDAEAGKNKGSQTFDQLEPGTYTWFVEILDTNRLAELNLVIFVPMEMFTVE